MSIFKHNSKLQFDLVAKVETMGYRMYISMDEPFDLRNDVQPLLNFLAELRKTVAPDYDSVKQELSNYKELFSMLKISKEDKPKTVENNLHVDLYLGTKK